MSENHDDSFDTMITDSSDKSAVETITDENSEYVQPRYHSLELPILASAVNPGQNVKCVPETPGQIFATSSDCVGGGCHRILGNLLSWQMKCITT